MAIACVDIEILSEYFLADKITMTDIAAKVAGLYLSPIWSAPRKFGLILPNVFALIDSRVPRFDLSELRHLVCGLQEKLFGKGDGGRVSILTFDADDQHRPGSEASQQDLIFALLGNQYAGELPGRIVRITHGDIDIVSDIDSRASHSKSDALSHGDASDVLFRGVFHLQQNQFFGSILSIREQRWRIPGHFSTGGREGEIRRRLSSVFSAAKATSGAKDLGFVFAQISYSDIIMSSSRSALKNLLTESGVDRQRNVIASVCDVPRAPAPHAMTILCDFARRHFDHVDLRIEDPGFRLDMIPSNFANSVTLVLPAKTNPLRLAALSAFTQQSNTYRQRALWQAVDNVQSRREFDACKDANVRLIAGPAVCRPLRRPIATTVSHPLFQPAARPVAALA